MRRVAATLTLIGLIASPVAAQPRGGRYGAEGQGIPPGHLPPPGECRVWYDNRPPGRQPAPTSCREAERVASRDRNARVIYGDGRRGDRERDDRRGRERAIPRDPAGYPYPERYPSQGRSPYPGRYPSGGYEYHAVPFGNGYEDGYDKGRDDGRDNDPYDPARHSRYRSADRGYDRRYGAKNDYQVVYRDGFRAGYEDGYRDHDRYRSDRRSSGIRLPWPF